MNFDIFLYPSHPSLLSSISLFPSRNAMYLAFYCFVHYPGFLYYLSFFGSFVIEKGLFFSLFRLSIFLVSNKVGNLLWKFIMYNQYIIAENYLNVYIFYYCYLGKFLSYLDHISYRGEGDSSLWVLEIK